MIWKKNWTLVRAVWCLRVISGQFCTVASVPLLRGAPVFECARLQIGDSTTMGPYNLGRQRQPTLKLVADLLQQASLDLESALEEKALLLARVCNPIGAFFYYMFATDYT